MGAKLVKWIGKAIFGKRILPPAINDVWGIAVLLRELFYPHYSVPTKDGQVLAVNHVCYDTQCKILRGYSIFTAMNE